MLYQNMLADPQTLGAQYRLGNHRNTYQQYSSAIVVSAVMCGIFVIGGGLFSWWAFTHLSLDLGWGIGTVALVLAVLSLLGLLGAYRGRVKRVFVYDEGMIHIGRRSRQTVIYWKDVQTVFHNVSVSRDENDNTSVSHFYIVNCLDGTSLKLDGIFGDEELGHSIEVATARNLFPVALHTYQMSHAVTFGPLVVTPQGLYHGPNLRPWGEMEGVEIGNDILIRKKGKRSAWASIKMAKVPNVEVFRMLVAHITGEQP